MTDRQEYRQRVRELAGQIPAGEFEPFLYQCDRYLECFLSNRDYFGESVNNRLTAYFDAETGAVTGFHYELPKECCQALTDKTLSWTQILDGRLDGFLGLLCRSETARKFCELLDAPRTGSED
jgi:hypothetical protein